LQASAHRPRAVYIFASETGPSEYEVRCVKTPGIRMSRPVGYARPRRRPPGQQSRATYYIYLDPLPESAKPKYWDMQIDVLAPAPRSMVADLPKKPISPSETGREWLSPEAINLPFSPNTSRARHERLASQPPEMSIDAFVSFTPADSYNRGASASRGADLAYP
jgi:hypothetical protein